MEECFLFYDLSAAEKEAVQKKIAAPLTFERDAELYRCGQIGILLEGSAKVIRRNRSGMSVTMRTIGANEIFGSASVFGPWESSASSITSNSACRVIYLTENELSVLFSSYPSVALRYITFLSDRIRFLNRKIDTFSADRTAEKLYEYLSDRAGTDDAITISFGMAELARRLKVGRTSLYRSIKELEADGLIQRNKNQFKLL